jgi:hypothetical protein
MEDDRHRSQECIFQILLPNGLSAKIAAPIPVLKHILVALGGEESIPSWLVHFLMVAADEEEA